MGTSVRYMSLSTVRLADFARNVRPLADFWCELSRSMAALQAAQGAMHARYIRKGLI